MDERIEQAKQLAIRAHEGQKRWNGDPYITHPERVADSFPLESSLHKIVGWLHDVIEDTDVILDEIREGFGSEVAFAVGSVTRREGESYLDFILRAKENPIGIAVKIADIRDNLRDLDLCEGDPLYEKKEGMLDKYLLAIHILTNGKGVTWPEKAT